MVRHAQSVSNARNVWQGQGDSPLSDTGRAQTAALKRVFRAESYDLVLSSAAAAERSMPDSTGSDDAPTRSEELANV